MIKKILNYLGIIALGTIGTQVQAKITSEIKSNSNTSSWVSVNGLNKKHPTPLSKTSTSALTPELKVLATTIVALNDYYVLPSGGGTTTISVLSNDKLGSNPASTSNVNLSISNTGTLPFGVTLNPSGTITVAPSVPDGYYYFTYQICEKNVSPANCTTATVGITVGEVCTEPVNGQPFNWSYPNSSQTTITSTTIQPATNYGFTFDVYSLDNSFNMSVNGTDIATGEIQFQQEGTPGINIEFQDGTKYATNSTAGTAGYTNKVIWQLVGDATHPIIRVVISPVGTISLYGSKTSGGSLFPLKFKTGVGNAITMNNINWNATGSNTIVIKQLVTGATTMNGAGYGNNIIPCPFTCSTNMYIAQNKPTGLFGVDTSNISNLGFNPIGATTTIAYNAIGYNPIDGYIYGMINSTKKIIKIGNNGSYVVHADLTSLPTGNYIAGEIDDAGNYYIKSGGLNNKLYKINLLTNTYTTITLSDTISLFDIAFNTQNGLLYGVSSTNKLYSINPNNGQVTEIGNTNTTGTFGGMVGADGNIYGFNNSGGFYQFSLITGVGNLLSSSPATDNNDAAHCVTAPLVDFVCFNDPATGGTNNDTKVGITLLKRAGASPLQADNWPMVRKSGHIALESNTQGFVVTRMTTAQLDAIKTANNAVEGMMSYDTVAKCLKIYDGTDWKCFSKASCP